MWITDAAQAKEIQDILYSGKRQTTQGGTENLQGGVKNAVSDKMQDTEASGKSSGVNLSISGEGMDYLHEMLQNQTEASEKAGEAVNDLAKIMTIARRIARGDKVPASDEKKLIEYDPELYQIAKQAAVMNEHKKHKKYKALFEDEDGVTPEKLRELNQGVSDGDTEAFAQISPEGASDASHGDSGENCP